MSASFYASPTIGATTTVAVFFHEIPHEVGDFALLVQSGFSKRAAMGSQFITAIGAFLGTLIGIAVQEFGGPGVEETMGMPRNAGLWGTSLVSASSSFAQFFIPRNGIHHVIFEMKTNKRRLGAICCFRLRPALFST